MRKTKDAVVKMTDRLNPEALRTVADVIFRHCGGYVDTTPADAERAARAVLRKLAALPAPRTITTVEELAALPVGTVIQDFNDDIMQIIELDNDDTSTRERGGVREFGFEEGRFEFLSWVKLPAMVLWVPTEGGGE